MIDKKRLHGIDLLKIMSMFMVVIMHVLLHGGIMNATVGVGGANMYVSGALYSLSLPAVNCFAMATGFLMAKTIYKFERVITLWLQVFCYSAFFTILLMFIAPAQISRDDCLQSVFPVTYSQYWYFTAYFGMFLLSPILNMAIKHLSKKAMLLTLISIFVCFSAVPVITSRDIFYVNGGYSALWLCVDYLIGGFISKHEVFKGVKRLPFFASYLLCSAAVFAYQYVYLKGQPGRLSLIGYSSPFVLLSAISLLLLFSSIQIKSEKIGKIISFLSKISFGVYLLHEQPAIRKLFIENKFVFLSDKAPLLFVVLFLASVSCIYAVGLCVDGIRYGIFKLIRVNRIISAVTEKKLKDKTSQ